MSELINDKRSTTPETAQRHLTQMSKSEITYDSRMAQLKASQSPHKENLSAEVAKMTENSKKMMDLIEQMTKREETKSKQLLTQNQIIQDLKLKLEELAGKQSDKQNLTDDESSRIEEESQETQLYLALLNELRIKQDAIDSLMVKTTQMDEAIKEIENSQKINLLISAEKQVVQDNDISFVQQEKIQNEQVEISNEQNERKEDSQHQLKIQELQQQLILNSSSVEELKESTENITNKVQELKETIESMKQQINDIAQSKLDIQKNNGDEQDANEQRNDSLQGNSVMEERIKLMDETIASLQVQIHEFQDQQKKRLESLEYPECDESEVNPEKKGSLILNFFKELFLLIGVGLFIFTIKELTYNK